MPNTPGCWENTGGQNGSAGTGLNCTAGCREDPGKSDSGGRGGWGAGTLVAVRQELLSNLERLVAFFSFEIKFSLLKYRIQLFSIFFI